MNRLKYGLLAASALCTSSLIVTSSPAIARDRTDVSISINLGNAAFGYSDGYYDQDRNWHGWQNDDERNWYRENHRGTYYDMDRAQDGDRHRSDWRNGRRADWRADSDSADFTITLGNVEFGYNDGYYDRNRQWHYWSTDSERDWYRRNREASYNDMRRDDDRDQFRHDWRDGRRPDWHRDNGSISFSIVLGRAVIGYSDGYYDDNRGWHAWRSNSERAWFRRNRSRNYYDVTHTRERDRHRRDWRDGRRDDWRDGGERN